MWSKIKGFLNSSFVFNVSNYALYALIAYFFSPIASICVGVVALVLCGLSAYIDKTELVVAHVTTESDLESILENGFEDGKAEANLSEKDKAKYTQRGVKENICFTVDRLEPVIKMRTKFAEGTPKGEEPLRTIYFKVKNTNNVRLSSMFVGNLFYTYDYGTIVEVGINKSIINDMITKGEYTLDTNEDFGKGFKPTMARVVKCLWIDSSFCEVLTIVKG
jgi:hypothetical protein